MGFWGKYVFARDHKVIGMQFMMTALFMLFIGGGLALAVHVAIPGPRVVGEAEPEAAGDRDAVPVRGDLFIAGAAFIRARRVV